MPHTEQFRRTTLPLEMREMESVQNALAYAEQRRPTYVFPPSKPLRPRLQETANSKEVEHFVKELTNMLPLVFKPILNK